MALIKCLGCGHMVSDKGTKCPKCGTPIQKVEEAAKPTEKVEKVIAEVESPIIKTPKADSPINESPKDDNPISESSIVETDVPIDEYVDEPQKNKKGIVAFVCGIVVIAAMAGAFFMWHSNKSGEIDNTIAANDSVSNVQVEDTVQVEEVVEEAVVEDYADSVSTENVNESICYSYIQALYDYAEDDNVSCYYFLYDITKDGIPELWIKVGTCEADFTLMVYTYEDGLYKTICEKPAGHSAFYKGRDYILQQYAHQGVAAWIKLTYDGNKVIEKTIFEEDINGTDNEYKMPTEQIIELYTFNNEQPIKKAFGME